jgi:hypothetical protein
MLLAAAAPCWLLRQAVLQPLLLLQQRELLARQVLHCFTRS